jgi:putative redox protein
MMTDEWKEVIANWKGGSGFVGTNSGGALVQIGTVDGQQGASPMELLLLGLAGCTGVDIASILSKMRQNLVDLRITVRGLRAPEHPRIYTQIEVLYELWGEGLSPKFVEDAIALSENKYCSASAMLSASAEIKTRYVIHT